MKPPAGSMRGRLHIMRENTDSLVLTKLQKGTNPGVMGFPPRNFVPQRLLKSVQLLGTVFYGGFPDERSSGSFCVKKASKY